MNKVLLSNLILIFLLIAILYTLVYAGIRLDIEGVQCVVNPIKYYEKLHNITVPWQITAPEVTLNNFPNIRIEG